VFGGYQWFHDPVAVNADTFPWLAMGDISGSANLDLMNEDLRRALDVPGYRADSYHQALAEVPRLPGETGHERRMREISYLNLTRFVQILLDRKDRMSMAVGLEVRVPFCDHRLVQYVFNAPWAMKTFDEREKSLLRAACADVLPESVRQRVKSPYPSTQDPGYEHALRQAVRDLMRNYDLPSQQIMDLTAVRTRISQPVAETSPMGNRAPLERILQLDAWLRDYQVKLDV
jgi:asparagine synthase (glutamine-hydrolysing)